MHRAPSTLASLAALLVALPIAIHELNLAACYLGQCWHLDDRRLGHGLRGSDPRILTPGNEQQQNHQQSFAHQTSLHAIDLEQQLGFLDHRKYGAGGSKACAGTG